MPLPSVTQRIFNRGLGASGSAAIGLHLKIGVSSKGPVDEVVQVNNKRGLVEVFGSGPLVESVAFALNYASPVLVMRTPSTTAGVADAPVKTGTGTATLAVTGAPLDEYAVIIEILTGATNLAAGEAAFRFSLDNGQVYSSAIAVPVSGAYPISDTGLTITWTNGAGTSFVAGDKWTFGTSAPVTDLVTIADTFEKALKSTDDFRFIHVVGPADTAANAAALAASLNTLLVAAEKAPVYRYTWAILECPAVTRSAAKLAFNPFASDRVMVCYGDAGYDSAVFKGNIIERNAAWVVAARMSAIRPAVDAAWVDLGALPQVRYLVYNDLDENGEMGDARFCTLCTVPKQRGFFIGKARLMAAPDTDFQYAVGRRVMDIACDVNAAAMSRYLNGKLAVDTTTGFILESEAVAIEGDVGQQLRVALGVGKKPEEADAVSAFIRVARDEPILTTQRLTTQVFTVPFAYAREIVSDQQFFNPTVGA